MSRLSVKGGRGRAAALLAVGLTAWAVGSTLLAQSFGPNCGCPGPCGCGAGALDVPITPAYPPYGEEYREPALGEPTPYYPEDFPEGQPDMPPAATPQPAQDLQLSQQFGGGGQFFLTNYAPPSIGDSFTPSAKVFFLQSEPIPNGGSSGVPPLCVPLPSGSAVLGRAKLADNNSPLPTDRIFFDYNFFNNAGLIPGGIDVHRFAPGFESTFLDGMMSFETRVPIASTANSDLTVDSGGNYIGDIENSELGNVQFMWKTLFVENAWGLIGGGMSVTVPTADDVEVRLDDGTPVLRIENEAVHLMPYVAVLRNYGPNVFFLTSAQLDFGVNGNPVLFDDGGGFMRIGELDDQTLLYLDSTLGAWVYRNPAAPVSGVAVVVEAHYTAGLEDMPSIATPEIIVGDPNEDLDMVNVTCGAHLALGPRSLLTLGYGFPVTGDRVFDGEVRLFWNRYY